MILLNPTHTNPTGALAASERRERDTARKLRMQRRYTAVLRQTNRRLESKLAAVRAAAS